MLKSAILASVALVSTQAIDLEVDVERYGYGSGGYGGYGGYGGNRGYVGGYGAFQTKPAPV